MKKNQTADELLDEARKMVALLTANLPSQVDPAEISYDAKVPYKALWYREAVLWRTEELSRCACEHYTTRQLASALTLTRAAVECVAATWYLMTLVEAVTTSKALGDFDDKVMRLLIGSKNDTTKLEAINVLSFLDKVEPTIPGFRRSYESLCEYAHPNWSGTSLLYARIDHEKILTEFGNNPRETERPLRHGLTALVGSLTTFEHAYNKISELTPDFIHICEGELRPPARHQ